MRENDRERQRKAEEKDQQKVGKRKKEAEKLRNPFSGRTLCVVGQYTGSIKQRKYQKGQDYLSCWPLQGTLQHTATHCNSTAIALQQHCNSTAYHVGPSKAHCNTLQHAATHCDTLQHTATNCNTLQQHYNSTATALPILLAPFGTLQFLWKGKCRVGGKQKVGGGKGRCKKKTCLATVHKENYQKRRGGGKARLSKKDNAHRCSAHKDCACANLQYTNTHTHTHTHAHKHMHALALRITFHTHKKTKKGGGAPSQV